MRDWWTDPLLLLLLLSFGLNDECKAICRPFCDVGSVYTYFIIILLLM